MTLQEANDKMLELTKLLKKYRQSFTDIEWHDTFNFDIFVAGHSNPANSFNNGELRWYAGCSSYGMSKFFDIKNRANDLLNKVSDLSDEERNFLQSF